MSMLAELGFRGISPVATRETRVEGPCHEGTRLGWSAMFPLAALVGFQFAGDALCRLLHLPLPGTVAGAALLFGALCRSPALHARIAPLSHAMLRNMLLFFIPASAGIMKSFGGLVAAGPALLVAVILGTWGSALLAALAFDFVDGRAKVDPPTLRLAQPPAKAAA